MYGYLVDMCDMVPNVGVAVALLNGVSVIRSPSEELSNKMGQSLDLSFSSTVEVKCVAHPKRANWLVSNFN